MYYYNLKYVESFPWENDHGIFVSISAFLDKSRRLYFKNDSGMKDKNASNGLCFVFILHNFLISYPALLVTKNIYTVKCIGHGTYEVWRKDYLTNRFITALETNPYMFDFEKEWHNA